MTLFPSGTRFHDLLENFMKILKAYSMVIMMTLSSTFKQSVYDVYTVYITDLGLGNL